MRKTYTTIEEVNKVRKLIEQNPAAKQYLVRADFEALACKTQQELDALNEYHDLLGANVSVAGGWPVRGEYTSETQARLNELESIVKPLKEAGEAGIKETFWTPGGAGYSEEATVGQPTTTLGGQEYYWTGTGYAAAPDAQATVDRLMAQGIPASQWSNYVQNASPEVQSYVAQAATQLATPLEGATIPQGISFGAEYTPTPDISDWMNVDWASIYGVPEGTTPYSIAGYTPTVAGAGYPFVTGEGQAYAEGEGLPPNAQIGDGWAIVEIEGGTIMPWSTPSGIQGLAAGTRKAEVYYQNPLTGAWESTGQFIPLEGEGVQYAMQYLQSLSTGAGALPAGYYESPFDVPADVAQQYGITYDPNTMLWRVGTFGGEEAAGLSEFEQWYMQQQLALDQQAQALREQQFAWEQEQAGQLTPWQQQQLDLAYEQLNQANEMTEYQAENLRLQEEYQNWQMGEAERQYKAQLAAEPVNWLQYAAYTGEQPVIQPWMTPLMPEQYGYTSAGEPIPGWTAESMTEMPQLTRPSAQYQARMGPTAQQQYYGYQQARTGATPEETEWRLWQTAPPSGSASRLAWSR